MQLIYANAILNQPPASTRFTRFNLTMDHEGRHARKGDVGGMHSTAFPGSALILG